MTDFYIDKVHEVPIQVWNVLVRAHAVGAAVQRSLSQTYDRAPVPESIWNSV
jgi:hypothetical protein